MQRQVLRRRVIRPSEPAASKPAATSTLAATVTRTGARRVNSRVDKQQTAREEVQLLLKRIKEQDETIDRVQEEKEACLAKIEALMKENGLEYETAMGYEASLSEKFTRQQTTVDPKRFRSKVSMDDFWDAVEVPVTKARKYLGEAEILGISSVKESESQGLQLTVKESKKSRK